MRPIQWHLKNNWKVPESLKKVIPIPRSLHPHLQHSPRSPITPNKTCSASLHRCIKRRVGHSLKRTHCKRNLVPSGKQAAYELSGMKGSLSSQKRVSGLLFRQNSCDINRQHHSDVIHKQARRHEVGPTLFPVMKNLDLVYQKTSNSQSMTHSRLTTW